MRMKKKALIAGIAVILAASAVVGCTWSQNQRKEQDYVKMGITLQKDRQTLKYRGKIDNRSFVRHSLGEAKAYPNINIKKTGSHTATYVLVYEGQTERIPYTVEVKDTGEPVVKLKGNHITLEYRQKYDVVGNIKSVRGPVDRPLRKTDKRAAGSYWIDSKLDVLETGSYTITIHV